MKRDWTVDALDQDYIDRSAAFLQEAVHFFGGAYSVIAQRDQVGPDEFVPNRVTFLYESFSPARKVEQEPEVEEHPDTADLEPQPSG